MYDTMLDKVVGQLSKIQADARTLAIIGQSGVDIGTNYLDVLAAAVSAVEHMSHCLTLQGKAQADRYLPPSSPLLDMSA